ncbi:MAG: 1-acyl-sn-glycerol-3-phosphate acyltransferase [Candidatus Obscuribacterales bacterium]|nr:1-acyl-sn-glycerol-3-phosphate acyltransferase [Candidatus Obscuribacterales bacterium]
MQLRFGPIEIKVIDNGLSELQNLKDKRVILCPNHPSAVDADIIFALSEILNEEFNYLAAHVLFYGHRGLNALLLEQMGCYPIVRGSADFDAFRTTLAILKEGKNKLVIFPEGEVSHDSHNVMTLEPGAVQIAMSALAEMKKHNREAPSILLLPLAIKYFYRTDITKALNQALRTIETKLSLRINSSNTLPQRITLMTESVLLRLEAQYACPSGRNDSLAHRIINVRTTILEYLAAKLNLKLPETETHLHWVHLLQKTLTQLRDGHLKLSQPLAVSKHEFIRTANKDIAHVLNFVSLDRTLPDENSAPEDLAEIVNLLELEVFGRAYNKGPRSVIIKVGKPLDLLEYFQSYRENKQKTVDECDKELAARLTNLLEQIENQHRPQLL